MSRPVDTYAAARDRVHYNNTLADVEKASPTLHGVMGDIILAFNYDKMLIENPGLGILTATDRDGRVFKIEVTQVDGPK